MNVNIFIKFNTNFLILSIQLKKATLLYKKYITVIYMCICILVYLENTKCFIFNNKILMYSKIKVITMSLVFVTYAYKKPQRIID